MLQAYLILILLRIASNLQNDIYKSFCIRMILQLQS
jgi:hypothetical protein